MAGDASEAACWSLPCRALPDGHEADDHVAFNGDDDEQEDRDDKDGE